MCKNCHTFFTKFEEKKTDVALINTLWNLVTDNHSDAYVLVTGDTDIAPGIKTIKNKYPQLKIYSLFPCGRKNDELISMVDGYFNMKAKKYQSHQLPNPVILANNRTIFKPLSW